MNRLAVLAVPAALLALALSGCGKQDGTAVPAPANQPGNTPSSAPVATGGKEDTSAAEDVKIAKCEKTSYTQKVLLEITNGTPTPWKYVVGVRITDDQGGSSEARFVENRIDPGKTHTEEIPGDTPLKGTIKCEIEEAKRMTAQ